MAADFFQPIIRTAYGSRMIAPLIVAGTAAAYAVAFTPLYRAVGEVATALVLFPVASAGMLAGWRGGLAAAFACILLNALLFSWVAENGMTAHLRLWPGMVATLLVGATTGELSGLLKTVRRRAAEERARNGAFLNSVLDGIQDGMCVVDTDLTVILVNKTVERWYAHKLPIPPRSRKCYEVFHDRAEPCERCPSRRTIESGEPHVEVVEHRSDKRHSWWAEVYTFPLRDSSGTLVGVIEYGRDITERKRMERELLLAEERKLRTVGRDLHDGIGQLLTALALKTRVLERRWEQRSLSESEHLSEIAAIIEQAKGQVRSLSKSLLSASVEEEGLAAALGELASTTEKLFGIPCRLTCGGQRLTIDGDVAVHLYRIAQEAVTNAVRHASPQEIDISLIAIQGTVLLTVRDDGAGIAESAGQGGGMGLKIMQYRAGVIGASLSVDSTSPRGTLVRCACPDLKRVRQ